MRIVIDSNVWISALVFGGNPRIVFEQVVLNGWVIVVSEEIFIEVRRVLSIKFPDFLDDFGVFQALLRSHIALAELGQLTVSACRDDDDNRVIETAIIGKSLNIITGDRDLLVLEKYKQIAIVTPADFLQREKV